MAVFFYFIGNSFRFNKNKKQLSQGLPQRSEGTAAEKKYAAKEARRRRRILRSRISCSLNRKGRAAIKC